MPHLLPLLLLLLCLPVYGQGPAARHERPLPPDTTAWLDTEGRYINAHGGGILLHKGTYYWFGEHRPERGFATTEGINCYSSRDLKNWKHRGIALSVCTTDTLSEISRGCIMERPKVLYNEETRQFVMWFHLELRGRGYEAARAGVAVADRPEGPYHFVRSTRVNPGQWPLNMPAENRTRQFPAEEVKEWWTPQWRQAVEQGLFVQRDLQDGQMSRDMTLFQDPADGRAYHIYSSEENLTLHIAELSDNYLSHTGRYIRLFPGGHNEAPAIFHDPATSTYWLIASGCTGWEPNEARLFSAPSIWGPWQQHPSPMRGPGAKRTFGGQSTFILPLPAKQGGGWIFMADVWHPRSLMYSGHLWIPIRMNPETGMPEIERQKKKK
ncbi:MAG: beta-glucanase [Bacteroides sp.]|nr:beta-glucanase [Bacteroides sp.]